MSDKCFHGQGTMAGHTEIFLVLNSKVVGNKNKMFDRTKPWSNGTTFNKGEQQGVQNCS